MKKFMTVIVVALTLLVVATSILFIYVQRSFEKIEERVAEGEAMQGGQGSQGMQELPAMEDVMAQGGLTQGDWDSDIIWDELDSRLERQFEEGDFRSDTTAFEKKDRFEINKERFEAVMAYDLDNNYPRTPEEVIRQYSEVYNVIYGNFILNPDLILDLVKQQRKFFAQSLLEANTLESQFEELLEALAVLSELNFYYIGRRQEDTIYDPALPNFATVDVVHFSRLRENFRITYLLEIEQDTRRWRIRSWDIQKEEL